MKDSLQRLGLNPHNSIVIGSGILDALGIRKSKDIDLVVSKDVYNFLKKSGEFKISENHGREILSDNLFEISEYWMPLGSIYKFSNLLNDSVVMGGVRYVNLEFLYKVKKIWIQHDKDIRQKDVDDVKLIEGYLRDKK